MSKNASVVLVEFESQQRPLTPVQKKFNQLTKKIGRQKQLLQEWKEVAEVAQQRVHGELIPLSEQLTLKRARLIEILHEASLNYKFNAKEQVQLGQLICKFGNLVLGRNLDDAQEKNIQHIFEVHSGINVAEESQAAFEEEKLQFIQELKEQFNIDPDDIDMDNPELLFEKIAQQQEQQQPQKPRKKTAKQLEKEQKQQQADAQANKSLKQIYQRLAASLHPDREPDEQKKVLKTELMRRATDAYQAEDLIGLIQLRVEISQQEQSHVGQLADEQLGLYNLNLTKYSKQLDVELLGYEAQLAELCRFDLFDPVTPKTVLRKLKDDKAFISFQNQELEYQINSLTNAKVMKAFIRQFF